MSEVTTIRVDQSIASVHPAARAWNTVQPKSYLPVRIDTLKDTAKTAVYRLCEEVPGGSHVIAKRYHSKKLEIERTVYTEILPKLPLPSLGFYGFLGSGADGFYWLFMEDAGEGFYSSDLERHRILAARWLGLFHTLSCKLSGAVSLPHRGEEYYFSHLQAGRIGIQRNVNNPYLGSTDVETLHSLLSKLDQIESRWATIRGLCDEMPHTLIHGDFVTKNVRISVKEGRESFIAFDWAEACWGYPAIDLFQFTGRAVTPDLLAYWEVAQARWPRLTLQRVREMADIGRIFRLLAAIEWASCKLSDEWLEAPMECMRIYEAEFDSASGVLQ